MVVCQKVCWLKLEQFLKPWKPYRIRELSIDFLLTSIASILFRTPPFFLAYEKKLIRNGYSSTEVIYGVTSMQVELGVVKIEQLDEAVAEQLQRYTYPVMPMDIRSILKSLGVKSTTVKLQVNWLKWLDKLITLSLIKAMTQSLSETKLEAIIWYLSFLKGKMPNSLIQSLIAIYTNCAI